MCVSWGWGSSSVNEPALLQALGLIITVVAGFPPNFTPTRFLVPSGALWGTGVTESSGHTDLGASPLLVLSLRSLETLDTCVASLWSL